MAAPFKVQISCYGNTVVFEASAPTSETRNANYDRYNIVHLPTDILAYRNTSARKFTVTGKLVSRNMEEAERNALYLTMIRSWVLPDFGGSGATPPIVQFSAYSNKNIDRLDCVITSYSWQFPDDVDYIYTSSEPMPVIASLTVDLEEIYSAEDVTNKFWKMKGVGGPGGEFGFLTNTADLTTIAGLFGFQGIAAEGAAAAQSVAQVANALQGVANNPASILSNPTFQGIGNVLNSGQISESTNVGSNPFITGSATSTPADSAAAASQAAAQAVDPFGRVDLDTPSFITI